MSLLTSKPCVSAVTVALAGLVGCGGEAPKGDRAAKGMVREADPIVVSVSPVRVEPMASLYSTSATLRAEKRATVTSRTRGVLQQIFVEEGDLVTEGQALAQLEDGEQKLAVARYQSIRDIKQREFERIESLSQKELVSENELELIRREAEEARHDFELASLTLDRTTIEAPFDGKVVQRYLDLGATVSDGSPMFDLADMDPLFVDVNVPERHVTRLAPGQNVRLSAEVLSAPVEARIERLAPVVDAATGTVKVTVAVDASVALRPGAFVEIDVVTAVHEEALVVARRSLVSEGRRWLVFRVDPSHETVTAVEVELGFEEGDRVEIARSVGERQLAAGDLVVVAGAAALSDGASIRILKDESQDAESDSVKLARETVVPSSNT